MSDTQDSGVRVNGQQLVGLFLFLRQRESELDTPTSAVLVRLERYLYERLSIEELEKLPNLYEKGVDVLR
jgi:hypothetical protein